MRGSCLLTPATQSSVGPANERLTAFSCSVKHRKIIWAAFGGPLPNKDKDKMTEAMRITLTTQPADARWEKSGLQH